MQVTHHVEGEQDVGQGLAHGGDISTGRRESLQRCAQLAEILATYPVTPGRERGFVLGKIRGRIERHRIPHHEGLLALRDEAVVTRGS